MYQDTTLKNHIETSSTVSMKSLILAEWNMNIADNIDVTGNYRYRPNDSGSAFYTIQSSYDSADTAGAYTDATYSHTVFNTGINSAGTEPTVFVTNNRKEELLYSLTDCLNRFRPRSGINKLRFFQGKYINYPNKDMFSQPRYYLSSKDDKFKYWTSYREEMVNNVAIKRGIGQTAAALGYYIDDAAPFVVYKNPVPANRLVVKMQTNVSSLENSSYRIDNNYPMADPFYEDPSAVSVITNQTTPITWKVQYLNNSNQWIDAKSFTSASTRANGKRVIDVDGYVQLDYGITNSLAFSYKLLGEYSSLYSLPLTAAVGDAYLVPDITQSTSGYVYVWNGTNWTTNSFIPTYGWYLAEEEIVDNTSIVTELVSPKVYGTPVNKYTATYREFQYIKGIRVVASTINKFNSTLDLIEMSPRLVADFSERTISYSIDKISSDIGNSGFPVGSLSVSNGSIDIFDYDQALNINNDITLNSGIITGSILSDTNWDISSKNLQLKFYEIIQNVLQDNGSYKNYYVPIKTMYVDGFPAINSEDRKVKLTLRDLFFYFESITAPSILLRNVSLTYAVATILDSIGFSNYSFKYAVDESDFTIPYFYVQPDITVAEVLKQLAESSQTAMFFDEVNNLILMSKNYLTGHLRNESLTLYGTDDFTKNGIIKNQSPSQSPTKTPLTNIVSLDSENNVVYNGGKIVYNNKYLQKSYSTIKEASLLPKNQVFKYKPVLLWEIAGTGITRPLNEEVADQSSYTLAALVLNTRLDDYLPSTDSGGNMVNNIINFGQSIYWATRYNGYFYNNGEIIKYDAVEFSRTIVPVKNLIADLLIGSNVFELTSGNINKLKVGQVIGQTSTPGGQFANNVKITAIDLDTGIITVSANHAASGNVIFNATELDTNVWITSIEEYQKYFAQLPFNGKLYPSGRVRIYAEPTYNTDGTLKTNSASITNITTTTGQSVTFTAANNFILGQNVSVSGLVITGTTVGGLTSTDLNQTYKITSCSSTGFTATALTKFEPPPTVQTKTATGTSITGAVAAKHGRMQFGTGTFDTNKQMKPCVHEVFDENSDWLNPDKAKTFAMASEWIFGNDHQYINTTYKVTTTASGATTYSTTGTVSSPYGPVNGRYYATIINLGANGNNFTVDQTISATGTGAFANAKVEEIVSTSTIKVSKPSTAFTAGALTEITGTSNAAGSNILNVTQDISSLETGYIYTSGSANIQDNTKIKKVKTFQVGATTYNQIILSKPIITSAISGGTSINFVDKILPTAALGSVNFDLNTQNQPTTSRYSIDLFDSSYYNESTYNKNQSKIRPVGSVKSSALTLSGALNFYDDAKITKYDGNGKYDGDNTFDVGDFVDIVTRTSDTQLDGTKTITAVTSGSFTVNSTIGNIFSKNATISSATSSSPYTATISVLNTTDLSNGQIITAENGLSATIGSLGTGAVTITGINGSASPKTITVSSTALMTDGKIINLRAPVSSGTWAKQGYAVVNSTNASDYVSYVYRPYFNKAVSNSPNPVYFGTRLRIIGELLKTQKDTNQIEQLPIGASRFATELAGGTTYEIKGTGGGIAINLDVTNNKNAGYYFEIDALTLSTLKDTASTASTSIPNVYFYKIFKKDTSAKEAVPIVLWFGDTNILCDDGSFAGQEKIIGNNNSSVYDLGISQVQEVDGTKIKKTFNLYINNKLVATVVDNDAIPTSDNYKNSALFVRGSGQVMFENFFTIADSKNVNGSDEYKTEYESNKQKFDTSSFRKYLINPFVLDKTLQSIGPNKPTLEYVVDYEEFGSIFRECAYFNVRYDKAYPALYSQISPTFNDRQGYVISGYTASPYNAEFLVFNATDFALNLDNTTGNYLRIQGVSFTQQSTHDVTVDEYFAKNSDFNTYNKLNTQYIDIQNSRNVYGRNDFTIQGEYIQNQDTANNLMKWIVDKIMKPKKSVGVKIFANPMIQLGDIIKINYAQDGVNIIDPNTKFVVYHITLNRTKDGPDMTLYLSEVV